MTKILPAISDYKRRVAAQPDILMRNRYIEKNPILQDGDGISYIQRPTVKRFVLVGDGPGRSVFHQPGAFDDDLFVAAYDTLYRVTGDGDSTAITTSLADAEIGGPVVFACTGPVGSTPSKLFFADGQTLRLYTENGFANQTLSGSAVANNDTVTIDGVVYKFTNASVDAGTPDGTVGNPWLVALGVSVLLSFDNLFKAINDSGTAGTDYSTACTAHTTVTAASNTTSGLTVRALSSGATGNAIAVSETGANIAWGAATLENGGDATVTQVPTPDDVGVIDLAFISGYVIVIPTQGGDFGTLNGRFYWIDPGESIIDPLNFATAERSSDPIYQVKVFGDIFWLTGQDSTEAWTPTGDAAAPMLRQQGILFDRGSYPGTALQVKDSLIVVEYDGGVFQIKGGDKRISTPDIEERIRKALAAQAVYDAAH